MRTIPMNSFFLTAASAAAIAGATTGNCVLHDDFSSSSGLWDLVATNSSVLAVTSANNRLDFWSMNANNGSQSIFAGAVSDGWTIDMTTDWAIEGYWHILVPPPTNGDVGLAFAIILEGDVGTFDLQRAYTLSGGLFYSPSDGYISHETTNLWINNQRYQQTSFARTYHEDTVYIWYDATSQTVFYDDELYGSTFGAVSLAGLSNANEALIAFAAYDMGYVPSFSMGSLWIDDICLIYGNVIGLEACPGDATGDGYIDVDDVLYVISAWDTADPDADFDNDGLVDADDVLILLSHYGEACP